MEFSPAIYNRLLGLYENKSEVSRGQQNLNLTQDQILYDVACDWLNEESDWGNIKMKNYQRWTDDGGSKKVLNIAGIFPLSGERYVAPELVPGKGLIFCC